MILGPLSYQDCWETGPWLEKKELTADKWRQKVAKTIYQQREIETGSSLQDNSSDNAMVLTNRKFYLNVLNLNSLWSFIR